MKERVHVVGMGVVSAIGNNVEEAFKSLEQGISGIGPITLFDTIHSFPVGEVKLTNQELSNRIRLKKSISRTAMLGLLAASQSIENAGIKLNKNWKTGFISATTVGGMDRTEEFMKDILNHKKPSLRDIMMHECGSSTEWIADKLGIRDFISTVNTACSSSVNSILLAARMIERGRLDCAIAGGSDALTKFTLNGFNSLMILDKEPCKPFDANRNGLNLGEGAGFLMLVSEKILTQEKLTSLAVISGYGNTNDAYHQTASSPDGNGSFLAMKSAIDMAKLKTSEIDYINLHGTGTMNNDASEGIAIQRVFEKKFPRVSSTKSYTGHTLGASGGIEAVFSVLSIVNRCVFPNLRFRDKIGELEYRPQEVFENELSINHVLSNSFGFGGNCSSVIFSNN